MVKILALLLVLLVAGSCGQIGSESATGASAVAEASAEDALADGSYSCEATNESRGTGPYSLECDKEGDVISLHFPNGGHIELDVESEESTAETAWEISATHTRTGDTWALTIEK